MTIKELLQQACEKAKLPGTAVDQLPHSLNDDTKEKLTLLPVDTVADILKEAVEQIDHGAVESIDLLVKKALSKA